MDYRKRGSTTNHENDDEECQTPQSTDKGGVECSSNGNEVFSARGGGRVRLSQ
jgi:hypothetical protein